VAWLHSGCGVIWQVLNNRPRSLPAYNKSSAKYHQPALLLPNKAADAEQARKTATQCTVRAACWSDLHDTAAAAAAFCAHPAVRHVLAVRTAGLPEALAEGLAHCAERFGGGGSQGPALGGSLTIVGSEGDAGAAGVRAAGPTKEDRPARGLSVHCWS